MTVSVWGLGGNLQVLGVAGQGLHICPFLPSQGNQNWSAGMAIREDHVEKVCNGFYYNIPLLTLRHEHQTVLPLWGGDK